MNDSSALGGVSSSATAAAVVAPPGSIGLCRPNPLSFAIAGRVSPVSTACAPSGRVMVTTAGAGLVGVGAGAMDGAGAAATGGAGTGAGALGAAVGETFGAGAVA